MTKSVFNGNYNENRKRMKREGDTVRMAREHKEDPRLKRAQERVDWQYITHAGKWLDADTVDKYQKEAERFLAEFGEVGGRRRLRIKLQEEYGVTEIEAVNILNGYNVQDYLVNTIVLKIGFQLFTQQ